jgi:tripartite-type tricarboxylate transporter receptor subunit TctC
VGSTKRQQAAPDAPTFIEAGLPGYELYGWWGMSAPAGISKAIQAKLSGLFTQILQEPATQKQLAAEAAEPHIMTPDAMRSFIGAEVKKWTEVAKQAGIRVD